MPQTTIPKSLQAATAAQMKEVLGDDEYAKVLAAASKTGPTTVSGRPLLEAIRGAIARCPKWRALFSADDKDGEDESKAQDDDEEEAEDGNEADEDEDSEEEGESEEESGDASVPTKRQALVVLGGKPGRLASTVQNALATWQKADEFVASAPLSQVVPAVAAYQKRFPDSFNAYQNVRQREADLLASIQTAAALASRTVRSAPKNFPRNK